jgi:tRNA pseudouridine55 synthase
MQDEFEEGKVLLIDKPYTWTSFDVVKKIKNTIKVKKIGHAGTLDPLATGLLILCTGKMTKQIDSYQAQEKEYTGRLVLGKTTPSIDLETEVDAEYSISHITSELVYQQVHSFVGDIEQIPPMHSAIQVDGQRLYKKARKGEIIELKPRAVSIKVFDITEINLPSITFRIVCSKGTYIRSLVRDFGVGLQSGAYLAELRRTRIGNFQIESALTVEEFVQNQRK